MDLSPENIFALSYFFNVKPKNKQIKKNQKKKKKEPFTIKNV